MPSWFVTSRCFIVQTRRNNTGHSQAGTHEFSSAFQKCFTWELFIIQNERVVFVTPGARGCKRQGPHIDDPCSYIDLDRTVTLPTILVLLRDVWHFLVLSTIFWLTASVYTCVQNHLHIAYCGVLLPVCARARAYVCVCVGEFPSFYEVVVWKGLRTPVLYHWY